MSSYPSYSGGISLRAAPLADYSLAVVSYSQSEPILTADMKAYLKEDSDDQANDAYISGLIAACRDLAETMTGRQVRRATLRMTLDGFPFGSDGGGGPHAGYHTAGLHSARGLIGLPRGPGCSVVSISYIDPNGVTQTLDSSLYKVSTTADPAVIAPAYGTTWPATRGEIEAVTITFVAGYTFANCPDVIRLAIKQGVAFLYEHRGDDDGAKIYLPRVMGSLLLGNWNGHYF